MIISDHQASQITPSWNKKTLTATKTLPENLSLKFLCDAIFLPLPGQCDIPSFKMTNFQIDEYTWSPNFSNYTKLKQKTSN